MAIENCPKCNGTGWISSDRDGLAVAERCSCVETERVDNLSRAGAHSAEFCQLVVRHVCAAKA